MAPKQAPVARADPVARVDQVPEAPMDHHAVIHTQEVTHHEPFILPREQEAPTIPRDQFVIHEPEVPAVHQDTFMMDKQETPVATQDQFMVEIQETRQEPGDQFMIRKQETPNQDQFIIQETPVVPQDQFVAHRQEPPQVTQDQFVIRKQERPDVTQDQFVARRKETPVAFQDQDQFVARRKETPVAFQDQDQFVVRKQERPDFTQDQFVARRKETHVAFQDQDQFPRHDFVTHEDSFRRQNPQTSRRQETPATFHKEDDEDRFHDVAKMFQDTVSFHQQDTHVVSEPHDFGRTHQEPIQVPRKTRPKGRLSARERAAAAAAAAAAAGGAEPTYAQATTASPRIHRVRTQPPAFSPDFEPTAPRPVPDAGYDDEDNLVPVPGMRQRGVTTEAPTTPKFRIVKYGSSAADLHYQGGEIFLTEVGALEDTPPEQVRAILSGLGSRRRGLGRPPAKPLVVKPKPAPPPLVAKTAVTRPPIARPPPAPKQQTAFKSTFTEPADYDYYYDYYYE